MRETAAVSPANPGSHPGIETKKTLGIRCENGAVVFIGSMCRNPDGCEQPECDQ